MLRILLLNVHYVMIFVEQVLELMGGGALMTMGFGVFIAGLLSDLISQNRQLSEIALEKIREMELSQSSPAADSVQKQD